MRIIIPGVPIAKMRPRATKRGRHICIYDPQEKQKKACQDLVAASLWQSQSDSNFQQIDFNGDSRSVLMVSLWFHMPIPASSSEREKNAKLWGFHSCKPDLDNLTKWILDILNGIAYHDDAQISHLHAYKIYSENPCTVIEICAIQKDMTKELEAVMKIFKPDDIDAMCSLMKRTSFFWDEISSLSPEVRLMAREEFAQMLVNFSNEFCPRLKKIMCKE